MAGPVQFAANRNTSLTSVLSAGGGLIPAPTPAQFNKALVQRIVTQPTVITGTGSLSYPASADLVGGTSTRSFGAVTTLAGDYIVVEIVIETNEPTDTYTVSATGLTFTNQNDVSNATGNSHTRIIQATAPDPSGGSRTVTVTPNTTSHNYRAHLTVVRGSNGVGNKANSTTAQTASLTRSGNNSGIFMAVGDWSAGSVGSPVWTPGGATTSSELQTGFATYIFGRWDNSGVAGTASHGISSPSYTTPSIGILEMLAAPGGTTTVDSGAIALTSASDFSTLGSVTVVASSALSSQSNAINTVIVSTNGIATLDGQSTLISIGVVAKIGSASLSGQATLVSVGSVNVSAVSTLTSQSNLVGSALVIESSVSSLSGQSNMTVAGTLARNGNAALTSSLTLNVSAVNMATGTSTLSGQANLVAAGTIGANNTANLSAQSNLTVSANVSTFGQSGLTSALTTNVNGLVTVKAVTSLSGQSNMVASAVDTVRGVISANSQSTLVASGFIGTVPVTVFLTSNSGLIVSGSVSETGSAALSSQSNMVVTPTVTVKATAGLSGQSNNTTAALITVISGTITPTIQSGLIVSGQKINNASANLSAQSTLTVNSKVMQFASSIFTAASNTTVTEVIKEFATVNMSVQSGLIANGFVPIVYLGIANFSVSATMTVSASANPPWIFPYIEFSEVKVSGSSGASGLVVIREGGSSKGNGREGSSAVVSIEGG